jgi:anti-sigma regulatory factor (Ser/Thr protein kinase)
VKEKVKEKTNTERPDDDLRTPERPPVPPGERQVFGLLSARSEVAPKICRDFVADALASLGHGKLSEPARLCTSELVTNIVLHAAGESMLLRLIVDPGLVRVGVYDNSTGMPAPGADDVGSVAPHGRGLQLVEAMADGWQAAEADPLRWYAKGIWFELRTPAAA